MSEAAGGVSAVVLPGTEFLWGDAPRRLWTPWNRWLRERWARQRDRLVEEHGCVLVALHRGLGSRGDGTFNVPDTAVIGPLQTFAQAEERRQQLAAAYPEVRFRVFVGSKDHFVTECAAAATALYEPNVDRALQRLGHGHYMEQAPTQPLEEGMSDHQALDFILEADPRPDELEAGTVRLEALDGG